MRITEKRFRPTLTTRGRKTGKEHSVTLLAVSCGGKVYFSRHRPDGDWFKNALANPKVEIKYDGRIFSGSARVVTDEELGRRISELKYPGEKKARERRVAIEVTLDSG